MLGLAILTCCALSSLLVLKVSGARILPVTTGTIIGGGRIGSFLFESNSKLDTLITRSAPKEISENGSGPIYVCTRNDDLNSVITSTPQTRRSDLVFLQNGILENLLTHHGLNDNTQGLIYFAISKKGETPIDGKTDLNPDGLTAITGKWGQDFAIRLNNAGLACHVLDKSDWEIAMYEKLIWICAFMIVGVKHGGCTVGEVEKAHNTEVQAIITDLAQAVTKTKGVKFPSGLSARLCAYARSVAHFPTALKEFSWRNGWFLDISKRCSTDGAADPCPLHTEMLKLVKSDAF